MLMKPSRSPLRLSNFLLRLIWHFRSMITYFENMFAPEENWSPTWLFAKFRVSTKFLSSSGVLCSIFTSKVLKDVGCVHCRAVACKKRFLGGIHGLVALSVIFGLYFCRHLILSNSFGLFFVTIVYFHRPFYIVSMRLITALFGYHADLSSRHITLC